MYPKVSVIISTYNRPARLSTALESVFNQTYTDFEVVVVDDCSPDQEAMHVLLEGWYNKFSSRNIEFIALRLGENSGYQCMPKNRGIEQASGDYIAYLDDDNAWRSDHLTECVAAIEADFSTDMVYTRLCYHAESDAKASYKEKTGKDLPEGDAVGEPWVPQTLNVRNFVDTSTVLHSKGAFWRLVRESGYGWDEKLRRFGDWNFIWRWAMFGLNAKLVDKVTVDYHWHSGCMQLLRPPVEVPVCLNYAQYQLLRKDRNAELASVS